MSLSGTQRTGQPDRDPFSFRHERACTAGAARRALYSCTREAKHANGTGYHLVNGGGGADGGLEQALPRCLHARASSVRRREPQGCCGRNLEGKRESE